VLCSLELASAFAEASEELGQRATATADRAHAALSDWGDHARTQELYTLLLEVAGAARREATRWRQLAERFIALSNDPAPHVHLCVRHVIEPAMDDAVPLTDDIPF